MSLILLIGDINRIQFLEERLDVCLEKDAFPHEFCCKVRQEWEDTSCPRGLSLPPSNLTAGASWETGTRDRKGNVLPRGGGGGPPELSPHFPSSKPPGPRQAMPPPRTH